MNHNVTGVVDDALQHHNREAGNTRYELGDFTVDVATPEDWRIVTEWGNGEHWNIGFHDSDCFFRVDPEGFFLARVEGQPVAAVSLVNYDDAYAVWGHYLVAPQARGKGYGIGVCKVASRHSGSRTTAGDAMPEQVVNYGKDGSVPIHRTVHNWGELTHLDQVPVSGVRVRAIDVSDLDAIADYDAQSFPAHRRTFLEGWLYADAHRGVLAEEEGKVVGYAVVRPAPIGHRIGPLTADRPEIARAILTELTAPLPAGERLSAFAPDLQPAAAGLFAELGLHEHFHVVRMWRGPRPELAHDRVYAIASLELG